MHPPIHRDEYRKYIFLPWDWISSFKDVKINKIMSRKSQPENHFKWNFFFFFFFSFLIFPFFIYIPIHRTCHALDSNVYDRQIFPFSNLFFFLYYYYISTFRYPSLRFCFQFKGLVWQRCAINFFVLEENRSGMGLKRIEKLEPNHNRWKRSFLEWSRVIKIVQLTEKWGHAALYIPCI